MCEDLAVGELDDNVTESLLVPKSASDLLVSNDL